MTRFLLSLCWVCFICDAAGGGQAAVSYGRQIAPIFALYCTGCHGLSNPSSDFRVTKFAALRAGGNIGDDIVPGHPEASSLMDFIEGKRGPAQRMPQNSAPLSAGQIDLIRQWIREGAKNDGARTTCYELRIPKVSLSSAALLEISARVTSPAFLTLSLLQPSPARELYVEEASVKAPRELANIAAPGEWIRWNLRRQQGWPSLATLTLRLQYTSGAVEGTTLMARTRPHGEQRASRLSPLSCGPP